MIIVFRRAALTRCYDMMRNCRGFTLVEVIIAIAVTMVLLGAIYTAVNSTQRHSVGIEGRVVAQQDVKAALDLMSLELSMASFNPTFSDGIWHTPPGGAAGCGTTSAKQEYRGIQEATANSIAVEMDINGNRVLGDPNETIRYVYDTAHQRITRATNCGGGNQAFLGAESGTRNVRVVNNDYDPVIPVFRYFDGQGTEIGDLPAGIPDIRRIEITLAVETEHINPNTGERQRLIYSTSVIPRNHVINQ